MSTSTFPGTAPQGAVPAIGIPDSRDIPRLVYSAPYFQTVPLAELIEPAVVEAVEAALPALVPPYVNAAVTAAVQAQAVLLSGSTMSGPLFLSPIMPTQPSQAASMSYVDLMVSTSGVPEVPAVPIGQTWARQTGMWTPVAEQSGVFLPIGGGTMQGQINMNGNGVVNLGPLPVMPNGAAPAQWVLSQIAAQSLYQGTWVPDTNTPDLTQPALQQNTFTWIAATSTVDGVVISPPIPGLQGLTIFNGDTVIYSTAAALFQVIHAGGVADDLYLPFTGGTMTGTLTLNADPTSAMQAATMQWVEAQVTGAGMPEAPATGQLYGRNGATKMWTPALPLAGGVLTGSLTLPANAVSPLNAVPLQQLNSTLSTFVPLAGNATMTGPLTMGAGATFTLNANAAQPLQAVTLQQMTGMLGAYVPITGNVTVTGPLTMGGAVTMGSTLTLNANPTVALGAATKQYVDSGFLPLAGGTLSGGLSSAGNIRTTNGRLIAQGAANNPSLTAFDTTGAYASAMWVAAGGVLQFGNADGNGAPTDATMTLDRNGNLTVQDTILVSNQMQIGAVAGRGPTITWLNAQWFDYMNSSGARVWWSPLLAGGVGGAAMELDGGGNLLTAGTVNGVALADLAATVEQLHAMVLALQAAAGSR